MHSLNAEEEFSSEHINLVKPFKVFNSISNI